MTPIIQELPLIPMGRVKVMGVRISRHHFSFRQVVHGGAMIHIQGATMTIIDVVTMIHIFMAIIQWDTAQDMFMELPIPMGGGMGVGITLVFRGKLPVAV